MQLGLFALKNLGRTPVRTALKVLSVAAVTAIMLVWGCLNAGLEVLLERTATSFEVGEFQLHAPGFLDNPTLYATLPKSGPWQASLKEHGFHVSPRLYASALAAAGSLSGGVQVRGLSLKDESTVTEIDQYLAAGTWLSKRQSKGVVLGKLLAKRLNAAPGKELVLLGQAADGSLSNDLFRVTGVLKSVNSDIDHRAFYIQTEAFREFFLMPTGVHELAVKRGNKSEDFRLATKRLQELKRQVGPGAELKTWRELKPVLSKILNLLSVSANFVFVFIYLALGGLLLNMMFMTVYDRLPEFGTMKALGMEPRQVTCLVLAEAGWIATFSAALACILGIPLALWLARYGLDLSFFFAQWSVAGINLEPIIYAQLSASQVLKPVLFMVGSLLLFSFYPGLEVAQMPPIKALSSR